MIIRFCRTATCGNTLLILIHAYEFKTLVIMRLIVVTCVFSAWNKQFFRKRLKSRHALTRTPFQHLYVNVDSYDMNMEEHKQSSHAYERVL